MALIRRSSPSFVYRDPFGGLLLDWPDFFRAFEWPRAFGGEGRLRVEEFVDGDVLVIRAELPGIDPDKDVELTISDGMLHIHAERRQEQKTEEKDFYRSELSYGAYTRAIPLPAGTREGDIRATYESGILEICVPFAQKKADTTKIKVVAKA